LGGWFEVSRPSGEFGLKWLFLFSVVHPLLDEDTIQMSLISILRSLLSGKDEYLEFFGVTLAAHGSS
jgi:hypothetical protein